MDEFAQIACEEALRSHLGQTAKFWRYDRTTPTPMNFVLDEVERQIGPRFTVYWLQDGAPEVFCLPDLSLTPVVFSTRYLELSAFVRHLVIEPFSADLRVDVTARTCLKLIAEMSLRYGDPEFAVLAFLKSVVGKGIILNDGDRLMELEYEAKNEAYMATWFYGLVHELGHLAPQSGDRAGEGGPYSHAGILHAIKLALAVFPYPEALKAMAVERATLPGSDSVLGIDRRRRGSCPPRSPRRRPGRRPPAPPQATSSPLLDLQGTD
jgi:hypothetical protein